MMSARRNVYLKMKTLAEARAILFDRFPVPDTFPTEVLPVPDAVGRTLAGHINAVLSSPNYHASAMDGIAVRAESTFGAHETSPRELTIGKDAFYVNTGHVLPPDTNAVIMIEHVHVLDDQRVEIQAPAYPWQHVRKMGEDIVATELLFTRDHVVTPYCVGALLSAGIFQVSVRKKPRLLIIPTGSELIDWQTAPTNRLKPGQVLESNSFVLGKLSEDAGGQFKRHPIVRDDTDTIRNTIREACRNKDYDIIVTVGGSSAGSEDYTRKVISDLGKVLVHGVTIMPGKPVVLGAIDDKPVIGIPGYPVSAIIAFEQFVRPLVYRMQGLPEETRPRIEVCPTRKITSRLGVEEFFRVKLGEVGDRIVATPLPRGSGSISSLTRADGIIRIPNEMEGIPANIPVQAELLRSRSAIQNTIVVVGSHDNTLDILADQIRSSHTQVSLSSSHVGSMGGLMAVKRGVCHTAGCHLLDTDTGGYNISYIQKFLPRFQGILLQLVLRDQGFIVPRGNPKAVKTFEDLIRNDIIFINRQSGSGTRILLDYHLNRLGIDPENITGYQNEEFTHMSVAVDVLSGRADVGLGIHAAAGALDLDFIPVATEQYDLIIPEEHLSSTAVQFLIETIRSDEFKQRVNVLGGYSTEKTGEIVYRFGS